MFVPLALLGAMVRSSDNAYPSRRYAYPPSPHTIHSQFELLDAKPQCEWQKLFAEIAVSYRSCRISSTNEIRRLHSMAVFFKVPARSLPTKILYGFKNRYIQSQRGQRTKQ